MHWQAVQHFCRSALKFCSDAFTFLYHRIYQGYAGVFRSADELLSSFQSIVYRNLQLKPCFFDTVFQPDSIRLHNEGRSPDLYPFFITYSSRQKSNELTLLKALTEPTKRTCTDEADCFKQSVRFVDEKEEASLVHKLLKLPGTARHAQGSHQMNELDSTQELYRISLIVTDCNRTWKGTITS